MESLSWVEQAEEQERVLLAEAGAAASSVPGDVSECTNVVEMEPGDHDPLPLQSLFRKVVRRGLVENRHEVEIQQRDPNSPLFSVKSFADLNLKADLLQGVYKIGFNYPSKIQEVALPALLCDSPYNMIAQSQSGTGKTATFVLAFLHRVNVNIPKPQILCLSPTYELAVQTGEVAASMAEFMTGLAIKYVIRGEAGVCGVPLQEHVIIGTPGKVLDWIKNGILKMDSITCFVLDEADIMVSQQGHQDQTYRIHRHLPEGCHRMFLSATYTDEIMRFARQLVPEAMIIRLKREEETLNNIRQRFVHCASEENKYRALTNIYGTITVGQAIIFCHTRVTARKLYCWMTRQGHAVGILSGELNIQERLNVLDIYRAGKYKALITTNVLSRGIDVSQTTLVVNWDMPIESDRSANCETYLHRIGRTGRFGTSGIAINLVDSAESFEVLRQIEQHFRIKIPSIDVDDHAEFEKLDN